MVKCEYFPVCSACDYWDIKYHDQKSNKIEILITAMNAQGINKPADSVEFVEIASEGLRHRADFSVQYNSAIGKHIFGFYDNSKKLMQIDICRQFSPELLEVYREFTAIKPIYRQNFIDKMSVRLRVSPDGKKFCWLDLSNINIKNLLDDGAYLNMLLQKNYVIEIGQKRKIVSQIKNCLKLSEPQEHNIFKTKSFMLSGYVSSFTQPSWISGDVLTDIILDWCKSTKAKTAIEFGSGLGQFTLPLLNSGIQMDCYEIDSEATKLLEKNAQAYSLEKNLKCYTGDFHRQAIDVVHNFDFALVNPARSGLKKFADELLTVAPKNIMYVSCYPESMITDLATLTKNYTIKQIKIVDQFPQTKHFETCILMEKLS